MIVGAVREPPFFFNYPPVVVSIRRIRFGSIPGGWVRRSLVSKPPSREIAATQRPGCSSREN